MASMKKVLEYLTDLTNNNDREWYHANKDRYKQANTEFEHFVGKANLLYTAIDIIER